MRCSVVGSLHIKEWVWPPHPEDNGTHSFEM